MIANRVIAVTVGSTLLGSSIAYINSLGSSSERLKVRQVSEKFQSDSQRFKLNKKQKPFGQGTELLLNLCMSVTRYLSATVTTGVTASLFAKFYSNEKTAPTQNALQTRLVKQQSYEKLKMESHNKQFGEGTEFLLIV
ncbi:hypothetical protein BC833DRAFT_617746 [Globomyces pollinis-pini]|nr:hypothetical protein BC833DRAFT_617746 [Globomyces pollinis-pini]